jgi:hypothetical protein
MGTRHLIEVVNNNEIKVAQYGQWDGYPDGQGVDILSFLSKLDNLDTFKKQLDKVRFLTTEEINLINDKLSKREINMPPELSRDTSAKLLPMIMEIEDDKELLLHNKHDFGYDSLFCEWAYVIDLDKNVLEVYRGFVTEKDKQAERWHTDNKTNNNPDTSYFGVELVKSFELNNLPPEQVFLGYFTEDEDEE